MKKIRTNWAIGMYCGQTPFELTACPDADNPVLTFKDVTDIQAEFVADPFMVYDKDTWYMFFEVLNKKTNQGDIAFATSKDGFDWAYQQVVLDEAFHLSYPYVFKWQDEYYMIPESKRANSVRLYKSTEFPKQWKFVGTLLDDVGYIDPSIFYFDNMWWMFASSGKNSVLHLFFADNLTGPWTEHPKSPLIKGDPNIARPAGRVLVFGDKIIRYTQDDYPGYGDHVRYFEILELTTTSYAEKEFEKPLVTKPQGFGWNVTGMHHIDTHRLNKNKWIAAMDGHGKKYAFGLKY